MIVDSKFIPRFFARKFELTAQPIIMFIVQLSNRDEVGFDA